jgi:hypothetical protein
MIDTIIHVAFSSLVFFVVTWGYYIYCSKLIKKYGTKSPPLWAKVVIWIFVICFDAPLNLTIASVYWLELPKEYLFTDRLNRWRKYADRGYHSLNWRQKRRLRDAVFICEEMLDQYDPRGYHCKRSKK